MANTSFKGQVRSQNGYNTYRKNSTTGTETTYGTREGGFYALGSTTGTSSILGFAPTDVLFGKGSNPDSIINPYTSGTTSIDDPLGNDIPLGSVLYYGDRVFRYGLAGGVALTAGKLVQTYVATAADHQDLAPTAAVAAGEYEISVETAGTDLTLNQYTGGYLYVNDAAGEGQCLKIQSNPVHDHSDDPSAVLTEGTAVLGHNVMRSDTTAGAVEPSSGSTLDIVGTCMLVDVTTDYSLIKLNI